MKYLGICVVVAGSIIGLVACGGHPAKDLAGDFTKVDSLTETYLTLQDSMLQSWNVMSNDENEKIRAMHELLHALLPLQHFDKDQLIAMEKRLDQVERIRFTQKTMSNPHVVEEYDFASNSLISELLSMTESDPSFATNSTLQTLVDRIRTADQRVEIYRTEYDSATVAFNRFIEKNKDYLKDMDEPLTPQKRPLFQMASEN